MASSPCHDTEIKHDVFISFRGSDVRRGLLSHLVKELRRRHIDAYVDDRLETGDEISSSLVKAIEGSQILLVIFSKDYASSKWCLEELVKIVECMKRNEQIVMPIFYNVDPSDVRHQQGDYGAAMAKHEENFKEDMVKIQVWRSALKKVAQLSGIHYPSTFENESDLVDEIVKDISNKLTKLCSSELDDPSESNGLVGIDRNIAWIKSLLTNETRKVLKLGIWGMGGIGKTTIAKVVFDTFSPKYEGCCFLENVREELEKHRLSYLKEKLFSELLEEEYRHINGTGKENYFKRVLSRKKVLIVLDDVNCPILLKGLLGSICLGPGSRVIVTSRDKQVFIPGEFHEICMVEELNFEESLKLFCINAFNERQPKVGYEELSKRAVVIAKGIPLALKVFGSYFHSKSKDTWECALESFKKYPNGKIQSVLRISYDGLHYTDKKIFLDIAFFFKEEDKDYVISRLDAWRFYGASGIQALQDKALITISIDNRIQMHDLIQEMGWELVREESEDPGRRSRLRDSEEVNDVLKNNKGTDSMEGMLLDVSQIGEVVFNVDSLNRMPKLRLLKFYTPLPVEVPMQIRYFVPEDFVNANIKRIAANDMIEEMDWEIVSRESGRSRSWDNEDISDVFKTNKEILDTIIKMQILRLTKLNLPMHAEHPMLSLPMLKEFFNVKGSPEQFVMLKKLSKLPAICQLLNYNEYDGVLVLETNNVSGSKRLKPLPNVNIGSALKELMGRGSEVHIKSVHNLFMNGCLVSKDFSVLTKETRPLNSTDAGVETLNSSIGLLSDNVRPKEFSVLPEEMRQLNLTDTRVELLNSSTGNFMSPERTDIDDLQLETFPNELLFSRSAYYHKLSNCREQDSGKPRFLVLFDGFRYSERMSFSILHELGFLLDGSCKWSYLWTICWPSPRLANRIFEYWLVRLTLDRTTRDNLGRVANTLPHLNVLILKDCRFLKGVDVRYCRFLIAVDVRYCRFLKAVYLSDCSFVEAPDLRGCWFLEAVYLSDCSFLEALDLRGCSFLKALHLRGCWFLEAVYLSDCSFLGAVDLRGCWFLGAVYLSDCSFFQALDLRGCRFLETLYLNGCRFPNAQDLRGFRFRDHCHLIKTKRHRDNVFDLETSGTGNGVNCGDQEPLPPTKKLRGLI